MATRCQFLGNVTALLAEAPRAVGSFSPGHWELMCQLERRAPEVIARRDLAVAALFLSEVAFLKRPHTMDHGAVRQAVLACPGEVLGAIDALARVGDLDYASMDVLARVPWFGRGGGRSFNSAVLRLVCPQSFGIVDWRNVAVLCCSPGFEGLVSPPVTFREFSRDDVVAMRGHLPFTMDMYRSYNDTLRSLAGAYRMRVADVDLALWTYSIQRQAFPQFAVPVVSSIIVLAGDTRVALQTDHYGVARRLVDGYLARLREAGPLSRDHLLVELSSLFGLIRDECVAYGRPKRGKLKDRVALVVRALDEAIDSQNPARLLSQWHRWQDMIDPSSPRWIGINLPTDMVLEGFLVLEDFIPVKEYIEAYYDGSTFGPRYECE